MTTNIPGANNRRKNISKHRRKAFDRVLSATTEGQCADDEDLQTLIDYCLDVQDKMCGERHEKFRPLYEVVAVILPEARRIYRQSHQNAGRAA